MVLERSLCRAARRAIRGSRGFTLLEVLVSIVVVALGLLGIAGLNVAGIRHNQLASVRSVAMQQAYDIAERMRANWVAEAAGAYNVVPIPAQDPGVECTGAAANCTPAQVAQVDLYLWNHRNALLLPNGYGVVCHTSMVDAGEPPAFAGGNGDPKCDNSAGSPYVIKIWWDEREPDRNGKRFRMLAVSFKPF